MKKKYFDPEFEISRFTLSEELLTDSNNQRPTDEDQIDIGGVTVPDGDDPHRGGWLKKNSECFSAFAVFT